METESTKPRPPALILVAVVAVAMVQLAWAYSRLPEIMATHFGSTGRANGWMPRDVFVAFQLGLYAIILLSFVGTAQFLGKIPARWFSLPNRDHWLAPERSHHTLAYIRRQMWWMASATLLFMVGVTELVIRVNLGAYAVLPTAPLLALVGAFLLYTLIWSLRFFRYFRRKPISRPV